MSLVHFSMYWFVLVGGKSGWFAKRRLQCIRITENVGNYNNLFLQFSRWARRTYHRSMLTMFSVPFHSFKTKWITIMRMGIDNNRWKIQSYQFDATSYEPLRRIHLLFPICHFSFVNVNCEKSQQFIDGFYLTSLMMSKIWTEINSEFAGEEAVLHRVGFIFFNWFIDLFIACSLYSTRWRHTAPHTLFPFLFVRNVELVYINSPMMLIAWIGNAGVNYLLLFIIPISDNISDGVIKTKITSTRHSSSISHQHISLLLFFFIHIGTKYQPSTSKRTSFERIGSHWCNIHPISKQ